MGWGDAAKDTIRLKSPVSEADARAARSAFEVLAEEMSKVQERLGSEQREAEPRRALIADDDPFYLGLLEDVLEGCGFKVTSASDGDEAWAAIRRDPTIRVAILNWMMPGRDGYEICRALKRSRAPAAYMILMAGSRLRHEIEKVLVPGANDYLIKPFGARDLGICLRRALHFLHLEDELKKAREHRRLCVRAREKLREIEAGIRSPDAGFG